MEIYRKVKQLKNLFPRKETIVRPGIVPKMEDTKELSLWKGEFGDDYRQRNIITEENLQHRVMQWSNNLNALIAFGSVKHLPQSILEVGCGAGINLHAIEQIYRNNGELVDCFACEPNLETRRMARNSLASRGLYPVWLQDEANATNLMLPSYAVDMAFTSGVLIHIHPDNQLKAMEEIYRVSRKHIICMEYFSPDLREINYHGQQALWTRDYGSLWLDNFNLRAIACMFAWKRMSGLDNITTWIFEKVN